MFGLFFDFAFGIVFKDNLLGFVTATFYLSHFPGD